MKDQPKLELLEKQSSKSESYIEHDNSSRAKYTEYISYFWNCAPEYKVHYLGKYMWYRTFGLFAENQAFMGRIDGLTPEYAELYGDM